jgi:alpha-L-fucosidase
VTPFLRHHRRFDDALKDRVNGEASYGTRRWRITHEGPLVPTYDPRLDQEWRWTVRDKIPMVHYTRKGNILCAVCLAWPGKTLRLQAPSPAGQTTVRMLGVGPVSWKFSGQGLTVEVPPLAVADLPCRHAWVFELAGLRNLECKESKNEEANSRLDLPVWAGVRLRG